MNLIDQEIFFVIIILFVQEYNKIAYFSTSVNLKYYLYNIKCFLMLQ